MTTVLALETSSEVASVALLHGNALISREMTGVQSHSQNVLPMAQALLAEAGLALVHCDAIAFGCGPGSFTGVRTACGIAQGLAFGADLPVVPVVTLMAMAEACREDCGATDVLAMLDARMNEVYWAQYRLDGQSGYWLEVMAPALSAASMVSAAGEPLATGNALSAYPDALSRFARYHSRTQLPHATAVARLGLLGLARGEAVSAAQAQPLYLRNKVALTTAERLARTGT